MENMIIQARKLTKIYHLLAEEIHAVNEVDLDIVRGEFVTVMGPSGSGKTTLFDMIGCLDRITSGELRINGIDVSTLEEKQLVGVRRGTIGFIFQDFSLVPTLTSLENIMLARFYARQKADKTKAALLLEKVGLAHRMHHMPKQMSGGEKQRVAIARALATDPRILLADEPTGHLDTERAEEIFDLFKTLSKDNNITVLATTHNLSLGQKADRTIYLQDGKLVDKDQSSLYI